MPIQNAPYLIPLTVAVTGHRDISPTDEERIGSMVAARLREFQQAYPATPITVLSGLAEGADMVFAEAALDLGIEVVPVLPSPPDVFAKDFERPAHGDRNPAELATRFRTLLKRCSEPVVVAEHLAEDDPKRYALVGSYLARHCHILFALWDGIESDAEGGTSHVVRLAMGSVPDPYREEHKRALDAPEPRAIHHLPVPRRGKTPSKPFEWSLVQGASGERQLTEDILAAIDRFNADAAALASRHPGVMTASISWFDAVSAILSKSELQVLNVFAAADALAMSLQGHSRRALKAIFWIGWIMVAAFDVYSNIWGHPSILGIYIVGLLGASAIHLLDRSRKTYTRFLDYRGLAEGLRVQLFYHLSGLTIPAADHYLRKQRSELTWIRHAMRALDMGQRRSTPRFDLIRKHWIDAQAEYYKSASKRDRSKFDRYKRLAVVLFISGLLVAGFGFLIELKTGGSLHDAMWMHWLVALMGFLPASAAALTGYTDRKGLGQHAKQYERMREIFSRAAGMVDSLDETKDIEAFKRLSAELGKEALAENADWILLHRERPIGLPGR